jgi:hypothetical protein
VKSARWWSDQGIDAGKCYTTTHAKGHIDQTRSMINQECTETSWTSQRNQNKKQFIELSISQRDSHSYPCRSKYLWGYPTREPESVKGISKLWYNISTLTLTQIHGSYFKDIRFSIKFWGQSFKIFGVDFPSSKSMVVHLVCMLLITMKDTTILKSSKSSKSQTKSRFICPHVILPWKIFTSVLHIQIHRFRHIHFTKYSTDESWQQPVRQILHWFNRFRWKEDFDNLLMSTWH